MSSYFSDIASRSSMPEGNILIPQVPFARTEDDFHVIQDSGGNDENPQEIEFTRNIPFSPANKIINPISSVKEITNQINIDKHISKSYLSRSAERVVVNNLSSKKEPEIIGPANQIQNEKLSQDTTTKKLPFQKDSEKEDERIKTLVPVKGVKDSPQPHEAILKQQPVSFISRLNPSLPAPVIVPVNFRSQEAEPPRLTIGKIIVEILPPVVPATAKVVTKVISAPAPSSHSRPNRLSVGLRH